MPASISGCPVQASAVCANGTYGSLKRWGRAAAPLALSAPVRAIAVPTFPRAGVTSARVLFKPCVISTAVCGHRPSPPMALVAPALPCSCRNPPPSPWKGVSVRADQVPGPPRCLAPWMRCREGRANGGVHELQGWLLPQPERPARARGSSLGAEGLGTRWGHPAAVPTAWPPRAGPAPQHPGHRGCLGASTPFGGVHPPKDAERRGCGQGCTWGPYNDHLVQLPEHFGDDQMLKPVIVEGIVQMSLQHWHRRVKRRCFKSIVVSPGGKSSAGSSAGGKAVMPTGTRYLVLQEKIRRR